MLKPVRQFIQCTCLLAGVIAANSATATPAHTVNDPYYGVSLFNFFQEKYFSAITQLLVREKKTSSADKNAEILLGSMYFYYDMPDKASGIFERLADPMLDQGVRDKAWFNLGKMFYVRNDHEATLRCLNQVGDTLSPEQAAERQTILINLYLQLGEDDKATEAFQAIPDNIIWKAYATFNSGVAFARKGEYEKATTTLLSMDTLPLQGKEVIALREKSKLASAYSFIRHDKPAEAVNLFNKIRLHGPLSNKALLGYGWAQHTLNHYDQAMLAWTELEARDNHDSSVMEARLAIAYTLELQQQYSNALAQYQASFQHYENKLKVLSGLINSARSGKLLDYLQPVTIREDSFHPRYAKSIQRTEYLPYLKRVFASKEFQQAHQEYHNLFYLADNLRQWQRHLPAFKLVLNERQKSFHRKKSTLNLAEHAQKLHQLQQQRDRLHQQYIQTRDKQDYLSLANDDEEEKLEILNDIDSRITRLAQRGDIAEQINKYRLIKGLLHWELQEQFPERLWQVEKSLKHLDEAIQQFSLQEKSLTNSWGRAPESFSGFDARVLQHSQQIQSLLDRTNQLTEKHAQYLNGLLYDELSAEYRRIDNYYIRAKYAYARLYDLLSNNASNTQ